MLAKWVERKLAERAERRRIEVRRAVLTNLVWAGIETKNRLRRRYGGQELQEQLARVDASIDAALAELEKLGRKP